MLRVCFLTALLLCIPWQASAANGSPPMLAASANGARSYFVSATDPAAGDDRDGSWQTPWRTISHAARVMRPGDTVWIRGGDYRETVLVDRSGEGPDLMLSFRALPGEQPTVRGSEVLTGWERAPSEPDRPIWETSWPFEHIFPSMVCADDVPLIPLSIPPATEELRPPKQYCRFFIGFGRGQKDMVPGSFCFDEVRRKLLVWLVGDEDPNTRRMETAVRPCWDSRGNYILVEGLRFKYCPLVVPVGGVAFVMTGPGGSPAEGCIVRNCEVSLSAFEGMVVRGGRRVTTLVEDCWVHHNGNGTGSMEGLGDADSDSWVIARRCRFTDNNLFNWNASWHAGGKHFGRRVLFDECEFTRHHRSPGLWFDCHQRECIVNRCHAHQNGQFQLYYEIGECGAFLNNIAEGGPHCCAVALNGSSRSLVANNLITASERGIIVGWEGNAEGQVCRVTCHNTVLNNVLIGRAFSLLTISPERNIACGNASDHNLFWRTNVPVAETDPTQWTVCEDGYDPSKPLPLAAWQQTRKLDLASRLLDPLLTLDAGILTRQPGSPTVSGGKRLSLEDVRAIFAVRPMPEITSNVDSASIKDHLPASEAFVRKVAELLTPPTGAAMPVGPLPSDDRAQSLEIANPGFEALKLAGTEARADVPDWHVVSGSPQDALTWHAMGTGLWNWYPPDGNNILVLDRPTGDASEVAVSQTLAATLQPDTRYRLSVWAGQPMQTENQPWPACTLELWAGDALLRSVEVLQPRITPHIGVWVESVVVVTTFAQVPPGKRLRIILRRQARGVRACFDRVALTATPL